MMNIKIHTTNFDNTESIESYVHKRLGSLTKFLSGAGDIESVLCEVELGKTTNHHKSGDIFRAEVNIKAPGIGQFYAVTEEADLYAAIDMVRDEIEREIVSKKTKKETLYRRGAAKFKSILKRISFK
jgi:ribosomal subunit interface protein